MLCSGFFSCSFLGQVVPVRSFFQLLYVPGKNFLVKADRGYIYIFQTINRTIVLYRGLSQFTISNHHIEPFTIYTHNYCTQIVNVRFCSIHQTHIRGLLFSCRIFFWCWEIGMLDIWGCCRNRELILYRIIRMWSLWYFYIFCYIWHKTYPAHISFYSHMPLIV